MYSSDCERTNGRTSGNAASIAFGDVFDAKVAKGENERESPKSSAKERCHGFRSFEAAR
jgi:hypothetical protein